MSSEAWSPIPSNWVVAPFEGVLPTSLYRYRSLSEKSVETRLDFELAQEAIFLAAADELNDPDEGRIRWALPSSYEEAVKYVAATLQAQNSTANPVDIIQAALETATNMSGSTHASTLIGENMHKIVGKLMRIACFTTKPLNGPMWTHYGNFVSAKGEVTAHGGICIEYAIDEGWRDLGLRPVEYVETRPEINLASKHNLEEQFAYASRVKSPDWQYEDEWRLVGYLQAQTPLPSNLKENAKLRLVDSIRSVIFGLNANSAEAERIIESVRRELPKFALKRVIRDESTAALTLAPI